MLFFPSVNFISTWLLCKVCSCCQFLAHQYTSMSSTTITLLPLAAGRPFSDHIMSHKRITEIEYVQCKNKNLHGNHYYKHLTWYLLNFSSNIYWLILLVGRCLISFYNITKARNNFSNVIPRLYTTVFNYVELLLHQSSFMNASRPTVTSVKIPWQKSPRHIFLINKV